MSNEKKYQISVDPKILELLGPSLYTNIYYILAELIANAYDADAKNVYIFIDDDAISIEDDGVGMSYCEGDIDKYLNVAGISRTAENDSITRFGRKKMGRKGIGKLAALSISNEVYITTIKNGEKSGFILSKTIGSDNLLQGIPEEKILFRKIDNQGTSVVMKNPTCNIHLTLSAIRECRQ